MKDGFPRPAQWQVRLARYSLYGLLITAIVLCLVFWKFGLFLLGTLGPTILLGWSIGTLMQHKWSNEKGKR